MPEISIVVPAYNEGESIVACLDRLVDSVSTPFEILVVYDSPEDTTAPFVADYALADPRVHPVLNSYGRGPAYAIRFGLYQARAPVAVVTMADGSDEAHLIDEMAQLVVEGAAVVAASRYMPGGHQIGGPPLKRTLSRLAGVSLYWLGRVGTHDATSAFKAYSTAFVREAQIESNRGFEVGLELVGKAKRMGRRVGEIPTTWRDRTEGSSNFRVAAWLPTYFRWYVRAMLPRPARRSAD